MLWSNFQACASWSFKNERQQRAFSSGGKWSFVQTPTRKNLKRTKQTFKVTFYRHYDQLHYRFQSVAIMKSNPTLARTCRFIVRPGPFTRGILGGADISVVAAAEPKLHGGATPAFHSRLMREERDFNTYHLSHQWDASSISPSPPCCCVAVLPRARGVRVRLILFRVSRTEWLVLRGVTDCPKTGLLFSSGESGSGSYLFLRCEYGRGAKDTTCRQPNGSQSFAFSSLSLSEVVCHIRDQQIYLNFPYFLPLPLKLRKLVSNIWKISS